MRLNSQALHGLVVRARSAVGRGVVYKLGRGGYNLKDPRVEWDKSRCDCSGFVSWVLRTQRRPKFSRPFWIETTAIWNDAQGKQLAFVKIPYPVPGCFVVFPDRKIFGHKKEGHIGVVSAVGEPGIYTVIDCTRKGIRDHSPTYFVTNSPIFVVHRDFVLE